MKARIFIIFSCCLLLLGCGESTISVAPGDAPVFRLDSGTSFLEPVAGETIFIRGHASDDVELASIEILIPAWSLKKTIDLSERKIKEYDLDYKFKTPDDASEEDVEFTIVVMDVGGQKTAFRYQLSATGDKTAPVLYANKDILSELQDVYTIVSNVDLTYDLRIDVVDDRGLKNLALSCEKLVLDRVVRICGTEYSLAEPVALKAGGEYEFYVSSEDMKGNKTEKTFRILVNNIPTYPVMYLADVDTDEELNSDLFGVPMLVDKTSDYTYSGKYYSEKENTEVRFLTNPATFSELTFGESAVNKGTLVSGRSVVDVTPIVLPKAGQYYQIDMDLAKSKVSVKEIDPGVNPNENVEIAIFPWYSPFVFPVGTTVNKLTFITDDYVMKKNERNSYLHSIDCLIKKNDEGQLLEFYFTNRSAWYPCWRFDATNNANLETITYCPDKTVKGAASKFVYNAPSEAWYTFSLDTYLNRIKAVPRIENQ